MCVILGMSYSRNSQTREEHTTLDREYFPTLEIMDGEGGQYPADTYAYILSSNRRNSTVIELRLDYVYRYIYGEPIWQTARISNHVTSPFPLEDAP